MREIVRHLLPVAVLWVAGAVLAGLASGASAASPTALDLWHEAMDYHHAKDTGRAMETFLKAYRADPAILGLDSEGLLDASIDHLRAGLNVQKDDLVLTFKLAEMLNLKGNLAEAIATYRKVIAINPNSPFAQQAAGEARKLEAYQRALAPAPPPSPSATSSPATTSSTSTASPASPAPDPSASPSASPAAEDTRITELEGKLAAAKEETAKVQEELEKLKDEHAKLQEEFEKARYYKNLFFSNPKNVELLNRGRIK